tara:strand:+ start:17775 stop:18371 length:597 start_codon:yes stop_codon:yes gene_type:complete
MKLDINVFGYIIMGFVLLMCLKIYQESETFNLKCIVSNVDGNKYCVRERSKIQLVADLLAKVTNKLKILVKHLKKKYPDRDNVDRLHTGFEPKEIYEILPTSKYTAYSENKGEKLAFCVTKKKHGNSLIDENTLTFVALHELSHIATKSVGHTSEFWNNFKFILKEAVKKNLYNPINYKETPTSYCSMKITDNPYYDM